MKKWFIGSAIAALVIISASAVSSPSKNHVTTTPVVAPASQSTPQPEAATTVQEPAATVAPVQQPATAPTNCPNGTYTNSAGNVVCSPYSAPSAPAGATARCRDGSYSFSQSRSGTCSHHGGVAEWL